MVSPGEPVSGGLRALRTSDGTNLGHFGPTEWLLLLVVAIIWGSSFAWIKIALESLHPGALSFGRIVLGGIAVWMFPAARKKIDRDHMPALIVVALAGNAGPAVFFALAEQRVESSVAGMLNAISPLMVLSISVGLTRVPPRRRQLIALAIGFGGAMVMALPNLTGVDAQPVGLLFVFCAVFGYALSNNLLPPLQQTYGGAAVMANALLVAGIVLLPYGVFGITKSEAEPLPLVALVILGVVGTGFARALFATLAGRVGAPRASIIGYLVPVVALIVGVVALGDNLHPLELTGMVIVLLSAWTISRQRSPAV